MLKIATLVAALAVASAFASEANAHGMGSFYASPFFRNQGMPQPQKKHCAKDERYRFEEAIARSREKRLAELRAQRAAEAAAASARRARLAAVEKKEAAKVAARKPIASTTELAAKKGDLQPVTTADPTPTKTASADQSATDAKVVPISAAQVCRKYSAAADALIEIPCE